MLTNDIPESTFSEPWLIQFLENDSQTTHDSLQNITEQTARLAVNEPCSWVKHEKLTGEILNEAAKRAAAETFKNICVYHPTQNHMPSQGGSNIRPDYIIAWSYNGVRRNTAVIDAKDHHGPVPRTEYDKICRDMQATKATRGILVLGENATISDKLRADIEKDNKVDVVQIQGDRANAVRDVTQYIGKITDENFVPDDERWTTYKPHVSSIESSKDHRPDPYGKSGKYTCDSTYHQFNYPRKQDGTIDERFEANRDRNKDGGPDKRVAHNKSKLAQEQHLNEDGSEDMRNKEHRQELVDETDHRLNVDGSRDMRCNENKAETAPSATSNTNNSQSTANVDMRQKENQAEVNNAASNETLQEETNVADTSVPTKSDGTADMRFTASKEAVAEGVIEPDEKLADSSSAAPTGNDEGSAISDIPTKSDGTADMRYTVSQDAVASEEISRDQVLDGSSECSTGGSVEISSGMMDNVESGGDGPLKADGTPDMRFSANQ